MVVASLRKRKPMSALCQHPLPERVHSGQRRLALDNTRQCYVSANEEDGY